MGQWVMVRAQRLSGISLYVVCFCVCVCVFSGFFFWFFFISYLPHFPFTTKLQLVESDGDPPALVPPPPRGRRAFHSRLRPAVPLAPFLALSPGFKIGTLYEECRRGGGRKGRGGGLIRGGFFFPRERRPVRSSSGPPGFVVVGEWGRVGDFFIHRFIGKQKKILFYRF